MDPAHPSKKAELIGKWEFVAIMMAKNVEIFVVYVATPGTMSRYSI